MAKKHMKRCSVSQIFREMQVKTTVRYYLTPVRMTIIKKSTPTPPKKKNAGVDMERKNPSDTVDKNVNWYSH